MWKIVPYAILQSILLTGGQVFLKFALSKMPPFAWTRDFWLSILTQPADCSLVLLHYYGCIS